MKDRGNLIRSAPAEVISDHSFKPPPARWRSVEYPGVGDFKLTESPFVDVTGSQVSPVNGEGKRRTKKLAPPQDPGGPKPFATVGSAPERKPLSRASEAIPALATAAGPTRGHSAKARWERGHRHWSSRRLLPHSESQR